MDKSILEEHLFQPLQTNSNIFKLAVTFLTGYNGIFNVTTEYNKFFFTVSINDDDFSVTSIPLGAHQLESLNNGVKRNFIEDGCFTKSN